MKHVALVALVALFVTSCGGVDDSDSQGSDEPIASEPQAILGDWTQWVSEEPLFSYGTCGQDAAVVTRAQCSGAYCDNMRLWCDPLPAGFTRLAGPFQWTPYVSEEQPVGVGCPGGHVIDGIRATGSYADNVSIRCSPTTFPPQGTNCKWTPYFSEEQGIQYFDYDVQSLFPGVAVAVSCRGSYCDDMSYWVCEPKCTKHSDCLSACNFATGRCVIG